MAEVTVKEGQNFLDVVLSLSGSIDGVIDVIRENGLEDSGVNTFITANQVLKNSLPPKNLEVFNFIEQQGLSFNTLDPPFGGYYEDGYIEEGYFIDV